MKQNKADYNLSPCPFCGKKARIILGWDGLYHAECSRCGCSTPSYSEAEACRERWNKRSYEWFFPGDKMPEELFGESECVLAIVERNISSMRLKHYELVWTEGGLWHTDGNVLCWMPLPREPIYNK